MKNPAAHINNFLTQQGSPLAGKGAVFVREGRRNGIDPMLLVAIAGAESDFGKHRPIQPIHNPFGWGPHIKFRSWDEAISTVARGLRKGYFNEGLKTISAIGEKWAPAGAANDPTNLNSNWARNVGKFYTMLGGAGFNVKPSSKTAAPFAAAALPVPPIPPSGAAPDFSQQVLQNVTDIGSGRFDPVASLSNLTMGVAAQPVGEGIPNFGGLAGAAPPAAGGFVPKPDGKWAGSYGVASQFASIGKGFGLDVTSEKRDRQNTTSGNPSDHWTGSKDSYAYDLSNGSAPTPQMDAAAKRIAAQLGVRWDGRSPLEIRKVVDGYRVQVLYRTDTGGNHFNHIHVGVRRVK